MGITSLAQQASATSLTGSITVPTVIAGDLGILDDYTQRSAADVTAVNPSGWTQYGTVSVFPGPGSFGYRRIISYRIFDGTESGSSVTGMDSTFDNKVMVTFRANEPIVSVTPTGFSGANASIIETDPAAQTVASGSGAAPLIVLGHYASQGLQVDPRTFTVGGSAAKDGEVAGDVYLYVAWKVYLSSPADVVVDQDDEGAINLLLSGYLQVRGARDSLPGFIRPARFYTRRF